MNEPAADRTALDVALDPSNDQTVQVDAIIAVYRALANPRRLKILAALRNPKTVAQLRVECDEHDPGSHLRDLVVIGLVEKIDGSFPVRWIRRPDATARLETLARRTVRA